MRFGPHSYAVATAVSYLSRPTPKALDGAAKEFADGLGTPGPAVLFLCADAGDSNGEPFRSRALSPIAERMSRRVGEQNLIVLDSPSDYRAVVASVGPEVTVLLRGVNQPIWPSISERLLAYLADPARQFNVAARQVSSDLLMPVGAARRTVRTRLSIPPFEDSAVRKQADARAGSAVNVGEGLKTLALKRMAGTAGLQLQPGEENSASATSGDLELRAVVVGLGPRSPDRPGGLGMISGSRYSVGNSREPAEVGIQYRVVDKATGEVIGTGEVHGQSRRNTAPLSSAQSDATGPGFAETALGEAARDAVNKLAETVASTIQRVHYVEADAVRTGESHLAVALGTSDGMSKGTHLPVSRQVRERDVTDPVSGRVLRAKFEPAGEVVLTEVSVHSSSGVWFDPVTSQDQLVVRTAVPAAASQLTRYPAITAPERIKAGETALVRISLGDRPADQPITVQTGSSTRSAANGGLALTLPSGSEWRIEVVLSAPDFDVEGGRETASLVLPAHGPSSFAEFRIAAKKEARGVVPIYATLWHEGVYLARLSRNIQIGNGPPTGPLPGPARPLLLDSTSKAPDLTVFLIETPNRETLVEIVSPYLRPVIAVQPFNASAGSWLEREYRKIETTAVARLLVHSPDSTLRAAPNASVPMMEGFGEEVYRRLAPQAFKVAFWELLGRQKREPGFQFHTIQIITNSPCYSMELMRPVSPDGSEFRDFVGVEFAVARWYAGESTDQLGRPPQKVPVTRLLAIAPHYDGRLTLPHQASELSALAHIPGYSPAGGSLDDVRRALIDPPPGILHFAGHGARAQDAGRPTRIPDPARRLRFGSGPVARACSRASEKRYLVLLQCL